LPYDPTFVERPAKGSSAGVEREHRRGQGTAPAVAVRVVESDGKAPRVKLTLQIHRFSERVRTRSAVLEVVELLAPRSRRRPRNSPYAIAAVRAIRRVGGPRCDEFRRPLCCRPTTGV